MLSVSINVRSKNNGPGYWKLNSTLLENDTYVDGMNKLINCRSQLSSTSKPKRIMWEMLNMRIKEYSIQFLINLGKQKKNVLKFYQHERSSLKKVISQHYQKSNSYENG